MTWTPPTIAQQKGLSYAPKPFAVISFFASCYVIYHIAWQDPEKRKRLYHRLVLAMNIALLFTSSMDIWGTWAVPEGTPHYEGAMGTVNTCTAQGFMNLMFYFTVPIYYGSLVLQAYLGIKHNFREEKYHWLEYAVHVVAYGWGFTMTTVIAATNNMNPASTGCWYEKSPKGCWSDPDVPCERGEDIDFIVYVLGFSHVFLYLIFPPSVILAMYFWIKKMEKKSSTTSHAGMSALREAFRKQMMQNMYRQIALYLFSFWFTWVFNLIHALYEPFSGNPGYNLNILGNCMMASQGFIFMVVYFTLQKMGRAKLELIQQHSSTKPGLGTKQLTVSDIRQSALRKEEGNMMSSKDIRDSIRSSFSFNIFDGTPDENSPWAMFIDPDSENEEDAGEVISSPPEDEVHEQYDQQVSETKRTSGSSNGV